MFTVQRNNLDLLRFLFASIVFFVHSHSISGSYNLRIFSYLSSAIAVKSFFIISGFLIFMSYQNSSSIKNYFFKRIRRIYPAYFVMIFLSALLGYFFSSHSWEIYFSFEWIKYIFLTYFF
jgi:peptidoglycan/LPS O-acetylase OafA/YrhL